MTNVPVYKLVPYKVGLEDTGRVLDRLSFREDSKVGDWRLYTRGDNEFTAIYGDRKFLIVGPYSTVDITKRDLNAIEKYIFNEGFGSRLVRRHVPELMMGSMLLEAAYFSYDTLTKGPIFRYIESLEPSLRGVGMQLLLLGFLLGPVLGGVAARITATIIEKRQASKLSKNAEHYLYGYNAEERLKNELAWEKVKSEEFGLARTV